MLSKSQKVIILIAGIVLLIYISWTLKQQYEIYKAENAFFQKYKK